MAAITFKVFLMVITESFTLWTALFMMNTPKSDRWPAWRQVLVIAPLSALAPLGVYFLFTDTSTVLFNFTSIPILLYTFCFGRLAFDSRPVKILLTILVANIWTGIGEILATFVFAIFQGYDLRTIYSYSYDEHPLEQWFFLVTILIAGLFVCRPVFHSVRSLQLLHQHFWYMLVGSYVIVPPLLNAKSVGVFKNHGWYIGTLICITSFIVVMIIFFGYVRKRLLQTELQNLYLEQKMLAEYDRVFEDMDRNIRYFRHDVSKHIDALNYLASHRELRIPEDQLCGYEKNLRQICRELARGNYCGKADLNAIFIRTEEDCRHRNIDFCVSLKDLDIDSLPVYLRMQMAQSMGEWALDEYDRGLAEGQTDVRLAVSGTSSSGFHMLSFALETGEESFAAAGRRDRLSRVRSIERNMKKLLKDYQPSIRSERTSQRRTLIVGWHS